MMNEYYNLELRIPKSHNVKKEANSSVNIENPNLCRFGFIAKLKRCFGDSNVTENMLFTDARSSAVEKRVRFKILEVADDELPHCRRNCTVPNIRRILSEGHLHDRSCENFKQETIEILGDRLFLNRLFMLQWLIDKLES